MGEDAKGATARTVTEAEDVLAGREGLRDLDDVLDSVAVPVDAFAAGARGEELRGLLVAAGLVGLVPRVDGADLVAAGAVRARGFGARRAVRLWPNAEFLSAPER